MSYLIEADVRGVHYWIKFLDVNQLRWELAGLKSNATEFYDWHKAVDAMRRINTKLKLRIVKMK